MDYKYLFPYEKVPYNSRILIYGAGTLGQDYYTQLSITKYCTVVGFIDKNYSNYRGSIVPVYSPQDIGKLSFDYVVVALRTEIAFNEIKRVLLEMGVSEDKIIAIFERQYEEIDVFGANNLYDENDRVSEYAFENTSESIAILTTGGFGDMVIQKRLITEIISLLPKCAIDIYNIKALDFLTYLYTDVTHIKNIIPDLGSRYLKNHKKYTLAFTIEACHFINVDYFNEDYWNKENPTFAERIRLLIQKTKEEAANISMPMYVTMHRRWLKGCNIYTGFNYDGVFEITDKKVNIPLDPQAQQLFSKIRNSWNADRYITINCGNGDCADSSLIAKSWPARYYDDLAANIAETYPNTYIVQLGDSGARKINGCNEYLLGREFPFVMHVLKHSYLHIDIEGGLVHMASQLGTRCIVLFGPTIPGYYGYENNINLRAGNCRNCFGLYSDVNKCARGMKEPECMYSIMPEMVFEYVKKELDK